VKLNTTLLAMSSPGPGRSTQIAQVCLLEDTTKGLISAFQERHLDPQRFRWHLSLIHCESRFLSQLRNVQAVCFVHCRPGRECQLLWSKIMCRFLSRVHCPRRVRLMRGELAFVAGGWILRVKPDTLPCVA